MIAKVASQRDLENASALSNACRVESYAIGAAMRQAGLPDQFIVAAVSAGNDFEGVFNLLTLWGDTADHTEKDAIIADLQELIDDCGQADIASTDCVRFDDLDRIAADVRKFKDNLRLLVDERGGISKLAELTSIPQPSLSRFFNTAAMPRRTTLNKIARALHLRQIEIASEWAV